MEKFINLLDKCSLKKSLGYIFSFTAIIVVILSVFSTIGLFIVQKNVMDSRGIVIKAEENVNVIKEENGYIIQEDTIIPEWQPLSPTQSIIYYGSVFGIIVLPILFTGLGVYVGSLFYYNLKIKEPIHLLQKSIESITSYNLDFSLSYDKEDEMGELCRCFEKMRSELRKDQYRINKLNEDKQVLIASVAHDVRTPLMVIKGYLSLLKKKLRTQNELLNILVNMQSAIERLENYVESIRNIQKFEEIDCEKKIISVDHVIEEIAEEFSPLLQKRNLKLILKNKCTSGYVKIDEKLLFRILENLIANAKRYAREKIIVTISTENNFKIIVEDDGVGFSEEILNRTIKLEKSTSKNQWGMGLYISKTLVEKMSGTLKIANRLEGGAIIYIQFPIE